MYLKVSLSQKVHLALSKQLFLKVYLSIKCKEPSKSDCDQSLENPTKIVFEKNKSNWLYIMMESGVDSNLTIKFTDNKRAQKLLRIS